MFVRKRDGMVLKAEISKDRKRAYHHFGLADVADSGNYTCKITTANGLSVNGNHQVFGLFFCSNFPRNHTYPHVCTQLLGFFN